MARVCENPYDRLCSMAMRDEDPQERMAELSLLAGRGIEAEPAPGD
jgi:hypothetical protein